MNKRLLFSAVILSFFFFQMCTPDNEQMSSEIECIEHEDFLIDSICHWYAAQAMQVDDVFDERCINLIASVGSIAENADNTTLFLKGVNSTFCEGSTLTRNISSIFSGSSLNINADFISDLRRGDIVEIEGVFNSISDSMLDSNLELVPSNISQDFDSEYKDCGILGFEWTRRVGAITYDWCFLKHKGQHLVYINADSESNIFKNPTFEFSINDSCNEMTLTNLEDGSSKIYEISFLVEKILWLIGEDETISMVSS